MGKVGGGLDIALGGRGLAASPLPPHPSLPTHSPLPSPPLPSPPRHLRTSSDSEVLLNILADEIHRAHQRCLQTTGCDPNSKKVDFLFEAGASAMQQLKGSYSCLCLVKDVGLVAFRDPHGIR